MKKILFILPSLAMGGLEKVQVALANALSRKGYDVTIMTLQLGDELKQDLNERIRFVYKEPRPFKLMRRIPYIRHKFFDDGMWETRVTAKQLYEYYVGQEQYDVEIAFFRGLAAKIISGSTNPHSVKLAWVHSDFNNCVGVASCFRNMNEVRKAYGKFEHIVCVSDQAKKSFNEVIGLPNKTITVYNILPIQDILTKSFEQCLTQKHMSTVLTVGRLVMAKGYDRLLSAVRRLNEEGIKFQLWIIGSGEEEDSLRQYAMANSLHNVYFLGQQKNPYCYMKQADLYVCSSRYEGYNLTVAEALLCGTPVLSTECAGPCEILDNGQYGMLVPNSEHGLYEGLKTLLEQPELLKEYQEKSLKRHTFFDEDRILQQVIKIFE